MFNSKAFTLTYGDCAENHKGIQILGHKSEYGFRIYDLIKFKKYFEKLGYECKLLKLDELSGYNNIDDLDYTAQFLVVKGGVDFILKDINKNHVDLFKEQDALNHDKKVFMYGRVVNKHARHNLCFADYEQDPDYENKKGRVVKFEDVPLTKFVREKLKEITELDELYCEGNYYYDIKKCGIGYHGDSERSKIIGVKLGNKIPLHFHWFYNCKPIGKPIVEMIGEGDIYMMSHKATGTDWKKKSIYTLRHSAGCEKFTKL